MALLYLRRAVAADEVIGPLGAEQVLTLLPAAEDSLSLEQSAPFLPLERELDRNGGLREALLDACPMAQVTRYGRIQCAYFVGLVPLLFLAIIDVKSLQRGSLGASASLAADLLFAFAIAWDCSRTTPRHPRATAAAYASVGVRLFSLAVFSNAANLFLILGLLALAGSILSATLAPMPREVADHLRKCLAIAPPTRLLSKTSPGYMKSIAYAVGASMLLPAVLYLLQTHHASLRIQLIAFLSFAWIIPKVGSRWFGIESASLTRSVAGALGTKSKQVQASWGTSMLAIRRICAAAVACLVLSFGMVRTAQGSLELASNLQTRMTSTTRSPLQDFVQRERVETNAASRLSPAFSLILLQALIVPVAEEIVYRGLVQQALRRRLARRTAIGLSSLLFGLAHLLVYQTAVYQTILLGLGFGLAFESAGILASILAHVLWNLWLIL